MLTYTTNRECNSRLLTYTRIYALVYYGGGESKSLLDRVALSP